MGKFRSGSGSTPYLGVSGSCMHCLIPEYTGFVLHLVELLPKSKKIVARSSDAAVQEKGAHVGL